MVGLKNDETLRVRGVVYGPSEGSMETVWELEIANRDQDEIIQVLQGVGFVDIRKSDLLGGLNPTTLLGCCDDVIFETVRNMQLGYRLVSAPLGDDKIFTLLGLPLE
jgi:hypothetical protein